MKRSLSLFLAALLCLAFSACNVPEHYLEQNRYDAAVHAASNRLDRKKQNSRHILALETAFAKANQNDLQTIDSLKLIGDLRTWEAIHKLHLGMAKRQKKVEAVLPLAGEDGYRPVVSLLSVQEMVAESWQKVLDLHLVDIRENLSQAVAGEKLQAREAYDHVKRLKKKYDWQDPLAEVLLDSAVRLGRVFILVNLEKNGFGFYGQQVASGLADELISGKKTWQVIHRKSQPGVGYDFTFQAKVTDAYVSGEDKYVSCRSVEKQVQVGQKEVKDTSGKVTYEPIFEKVSATIYDVRLEKRATARADFKAWNANGVSVLNTWTTVSEVFSESHSHYSGDSRALDVCLPTYFLESFPSDFWMLEHCATKVGCEIEYYLRKLDVER